MTKMKLSVVQKARYMVLVFPVAFLLFSIFAVLNAASPQSGYVPIQNTESSLSIAEIFSAVAFGYCALWMAIKILRKMKQHITISAELKSSLSFFLGLAIWRFSLYVGLLFLDLAAIIMLITLLQGKQFGPYTLYHKDVKIEKIS